MMEMEQRREDADKSRGRTKIEYVALALTYLAGIDFLKEYRNERELLIRNATHGKTKYSHRANWSTFLIATAFDCKAGFLYEIVLLSRWTGIDLMVKGARRHTRPKLPQ